MDAARHPLHLAGAGGLDPAPCAACRSARDGERQALARLAGERPHDFPPLCPTHGRDLGDLGGTALAPWLSALLLAEAERWQVPAPPAPHGGSRAPDPLAPRAPAPPGPSAPPSGPRAGAPCPVCSEGRRAAEAAIAELGPQLSSAAGRAAHALGPGLCLRHLHQALRSESTPTPSARWLAGDGARRLTRLGQDLERYFELTEYRLRHLPRGPEQDAWRRALAFLWPPACPRAAAAPEPPPRPPEPIPEWAWSDTALVRCIRALDGGGCPACRAARQAAAIHFRWLLVDNYSSLATIAALRRGGYCPHHARLLLDMDARQLSFTLLAIAGAEAALLSGGGAPPAALRGTACLACLEARNAAQVFIDDLALLWRHPEGRATYERSRGLCLPHSRVAAAGLRGPGAAWQRSATGGCLRRAAAEPGGGAARLWSSPPVPAPGEIWPQNGRDWSAPIGARLQRLPRPGEADGDGGDHGSGRSGGKSGSRSNGGGASGDGDISGGGSHSGDGDIGGGGSHSGSGGITAEPSAEHPRAPVDGGRGPA